MKTGKRLGTILHIGYEICCGGTISTNIGEGRLKGMQES